MWIYFVFSSLLMRRSHKKTEPVSPTFFFQVMNHWSTPGIAGAVLGLSLLLLCSGPWGITLGVSALFTGLMFSAGRFFEVNTTHKKQHKKRNSASSLVLPEPDPLEDFLCLLYDATPVKLKGMAIDAEINPDSPLIACVDEIKQDAAWAAVLHAGYLARLFGVHCEGVTVDTTNTKLGEQGMVSNLKVIPGGHWSATGSERQANQSHTIQLINHNEVIKNEVKGIHWTTMFGSKPASGQKEIREYLNNPGGGDCLFYAFSLGLARQMCDGIENAEALKETPLFQAWFRLDTNMNKLDACGALLALGKSTNPMEDVNIKSAWFYFQRSLRYLVADYIVEQLKVEGSRALEVYQAIKKKQAGQDDVKNKLLMANPLCEEFGILYNLELMNKEDEDDLRTNIFAKVHPDHALLAMTV